MFSYRCVPSLCGHYKIYHKQQWLTYPTVKQADLIQFIRYAMVGAMNTILTLVVIYACKDFSASTGG